MSTPPAPPPSAAGAEANERGFLFLLLCTLGGQTAGTMATMTLPAVAPAVAKSFGVPSSIIGYQISLLAAAMLFSLVFGANLSTRWGAARVQQVALGLLISGLLVATGPHLVFFFAAAICLGLGYGLLTPSASHLLMRFTPASRRNLLFSVKQTGVPLGGILAALIAPPIATAFGWRWALAVSALLMLGLVFLFARRRAFWDDDRDPQVRVIANPLGGIVTIWRSLPLRYLSLAGAFLVIPQFAISTFTVVLFVEEMGYSLVMAGVVLTASQVAGVAGRVFWGWAADRVGNCYTTLAILTGAMLVAALLCFLLSPAWPVALACALFFVFGSTASGWNGAFLAEIARITPRSQVSRVTGGSLFFVNVGKMLGPIAVANVYTLSGSYVIAFGCLTVTAAAALVCLLLARSAGFRSGLAANT